jgi:PAS domain S-box-containing protein
MTGETSPRIIVVDDNPAIHEDFRKILLAGRSRNDALEAVEAVLFEVAAPARPRLEFDLDFALQGREALKKVEQALVEQRPFSLAFVDIRMPPGWDGVETIEHLWKADPSLQVVICTAYSDYSWEKMSQRFGARDNLVILKKPFDNVEVLQLAHALTRKWEVTRQAQMRMDQLDQIVAERTVELRRSEERFATAFRVSPAALVIQEKETGRFVDINEAFIALTRFSREDVIGRPVDGFGWQVRYPEGSAAQWQNGAAQITTRSGEIRDVLISHANLVLGGRSHTLLIFQDISERVKLEAQLRQSQKMEAIGQLAAGVAHDFNNLLTIIEGHASLQLASRGLSEDTIESLRQIEIAAERAADLTRQLLAFSRQQILRPRPLDLNALINELLSLLRRTLGERVELNCDLEAGLPFVYADQTSIEQVIMNLTVNARDAMPKGGVITLSTRARLVSEASGLLSPDTKPGRYVAITVSDTGVGMDEATKARIFEPFFTTKEVNKGTGMGLATVYGIARQHDGWIDVVTTLGKGSSFQVFFPATDKTPESEKSPKPAPVARGDAQTVLVVEDDASVRGLAREILEQFDYRVIEASSGDVAWAGWPPIRAQVDLLLTDMVMPGELSGLELAEKLQADKPSLKIIYSSGYSSELFSSSVQLIEGVNYLPKPYLTSALVSIVRNAFTPAAKT